MAPLTRRLLFQRGRPKTNNLGKIRSLDLSGLELRSEHLDPNLLGRLKQLKELDLSNNLLETLPANLGLSRLLILRCTNNQLGDVTALHQFPDLEELSLEGNPFLTVNDNLKVCFLLPKLRKVNGKEAASACSQVENLDRELTYRVTAHWEKFMATVNPEEEADKFQTDFVTSAIRDVHYGPESLSEFTQWRVQMIAEKLVASGGAQVQEADIRKEPPQAAAASKPRCRAVASKRPDNVPHDLPSIKRVCSSPAAKTEDKPVDSDGGQAALHLEPLHFLQCHSRNNSPKDLETQLWACAFEPAREEGTHWGPRAVGGLGHTVVLSGSQIKRSLRNSVRLFLG